MKQHLINDVIQGMIPYLDNAQAEKLQEVLQHTLKDLVSVKTTLYSQSLAHSENLPWLIVLLFLLIQIKQ